MPEATPTIVTGLKVVMRNEDAKNLCISLIKSETEEEVIDHLKKYGLWENPNCWRTYGDNENNFAIIGNQQSNPESAIVEKIINSVDAVLMAECMKRGIHPESENAPRTIDEAVAKFFNVPNGKLSMIPTRMRKELAENIYFVATGPKKNPCYSIIDRGEGQTPARMPDTLLSLGRSNKLRIPFVQGKFNMGGTGVMQFCGKKNLQLIVSRRHPDITMFDDPDDNTRNLWGFTIIGREDPTEGVRSSIYKYLAPGGNVISFKSDSIPVLPGDYPDPYGKPMKWGTYVKLYDYQIRGWKTNILFDMYNRLSILLPSIGVPVRFYERRAGYRGHSMEHTMAGLIVRLEEDKNENIEKGFPISAVINVKGQQMKTSIYAFKKNRSEKYKKDEGVIFVINGQTHGYLTKDFYSRHTVGMAYLAESLLTIVDCSWIEGRFREDLFMNSRDRIRNGEIKDAIEKALGDMIRNSSGLRELREKRRREEIMNKIREDKPLASMIENILTKSPTLSKIFIEGARISNPFRMSFTKKFEEFTGKMYPSYFRLAEEYTFERPKEAHIGGRTRIKYHTDARNDYFDRDDNPGVFRIFLNGGETQEFSITLWEGIATLVIYLSTNEFKIGDMIHVETYVTDHTRSEPFSNSFYLYVKKKPVRKEKVEDENKMTKEKVTEKKEKSKIYDEEDTSITGASGASVEGSKFGLPNIIEVHETEWETYGFNPESALKVVDTGEGGWDFYINMDNKFLLTEVKYSTESPESIYGKFKYGIVLIGIAFLSDYEKRKDTSMDTDVNISDVVSNVTRILAPLIVPMVTELGKLGTFLDDAPPYEAVGTS